MSHVAAVEFDRLVPPKQNNADALYFVLTNNLRSVLRNLSMRKKENMKFSRKCSSIAFAHVHVAELLVFFYSDSHSAALASVALISQGTEVTVSGTEVTVSV